jgi:hypothetical protein
MREMSTGPTINKTADTFTGTLFFMSPERIKAGRYAYAVRLIKFKNYRLHIFLSFYGSVYQSLERHMELWKNDYVTIAGEEFVR